MDGFGGAIAGAEGDGVAGAGTTDAGADRPERGPLFRVETRLNLGSLFARFQVHAKLIRLLPPCFPGKELLDGWVVTH